MKHLTAFATAFLLLATVSAAHDGHEADGTFRVDSVNPDSPAAAAGMQAGDQMILLDGEEVATMEQLRKVMAAHKPGDTVPLTVERDGETVELKLTFGAHPDGGVVMGVQLAVSGEPGDDSGEGTAWCLEWIDKTYRINSMIRDLELDLADDYASILACVENITQELPSDRAIKYCDNFLKGHCPAMDLLTEIGEAQVLRCEQRLNQSLGVSLDQYKGWQACAQHDVFDRYALSGESSDERACKASFLEKCGTNIDAAIESGEISPEQREFVQCCSADTLDPQRAGQSCAMIDDGFSRGPCLDRPVCVNSTTTEWIQCSMLH